MRTEIALAALLLMGLAPAQAGVAHSPHFSAAEAHTIGRNELLSAVVGDDPWLVRRILDLVKHRSVAAAGPDPDLAAGPRDWRGTVEWNDLIKRARAEKDARGKTTGADRSSGGTVMLIDMMKRVKDKKAGAAQ